MAPVTSKAPWHDLTGHVALITGGNGGIGLGMARGLRQAGATVVIWGTNAAKNAAAVSELGAEGRDARWVRSSSTSATRPRWTRP